ncbi:lactonase family protein [Colwellia piezophila]|uniref:lactonase family protein n=1 Tax=Colwellia piezophila TaxID=211668 RepID=UPI00037B7B17|nr:beta-propeller fold lactonase family protein [Colwellia piezophila]
MLNQLKYRKNYHWTSSSLIKKYGLIILLVSFTSGCVSTHRPYSTQEPMREKQVLEDNQLRVDGLGGARVAELTPDGTQLLVVSADDNSLAIFNVDSDFQLTFHRIFINNSTIDGLNGAASLVVSPDGRRVYVVSYYDSAVAIFEQDEQGTYQFIRAIRDGLPYKDVFSDKKSVQEKDKLGLLGAYDIAITTDNSQLFVASVASNAVSIFDINKSGNVIFNHAIRDSDNTEYGLGGAVNVIITPNNSQVIVAGFNENAITIFNRNVNGGLVHSQTLINGKEGIKNMKAPQGLAMSPDGNYLYVACGGGNAIIVFARNDQGRYSYIQSISNSDDVNGLGGAGYVTTSPDGQRVFVASEVDNAVVTLARLNDGRLKILSVVKSEGIKKADELNGAASVYVSPNGKYLLVTTGKGDSLIVYSLH